MAKGYGVFDIIGSRTYSHYSEMDDYNVKLDKSISLENILVVPDSDKNSNRAPYLMDEHNLIMDDIIELTHDGPVLDFKRIFPIESMIAGLDRGLMQLPDRFRTTGNIQESKINHEVIRDRVRMWFRYQKGLINKAMCSESDFVDKPENTIITVPDNLSIDAQEDILYGVGNDRKYTLLWRSVAAAIGAEEYFYSEKLKEGDTITVFDRNKLGVSVVNLTLHKEEGRLIPGHHLYKYSDEEEINKKWYTHEENTKEFSTTQFFPYDFSREGFLAPKKKGFSSSFLRDMSRYLLPETKLAIVLGDDIKVLSSRITVVKDHNGELINRGAGRFAERMSNKIVSYFDECESLSIVVFNATTEEVKFKTLIEATDRLYGGLAVKGAPNTDNVWNTVTNKDGIDFFLRLGLQDSSKPLKLLHQNFVIEEIDEKVPNNIPLLMESELVAGQGRAKVKISAQNKQVHEKFFHEVELDWATMKTAIDKDSNEVITLGWLEEHQQRSFPVNVPDTKADVEKFGTDSKYWRKYYGNVCKIKAYLDGDISNVESVELAKSSYPKADAHGIERFERSNIMGMDWRTAYSKYPEIYELLDNLCKKLASDALLYWEDAGHVFTRIGWTYDRSGVFDRVVEKILKEAEEAGKWKTGLVAQKITIIANLVSDPKQIARFFSAFTDRLGWDTYNRNNYLPTSVNNWLRGITGLMMNHTAFMEFVPREKALYCASQLRYVAKENKKYSEIIFNNCIKTLIFLLKYRRYDQKFLKAPKDRDKSYSHGEYREQDIFVHDEIEKLLTDDILNCVRLRISKAKGHGWRWSTDIVLARNVCKVVDKEFLNRSSYTLDKDMRKVLAAGFSWEDKTVDLEIMLFNFLNGSGNIGVPEGF